jgi:hypothetical protein
MAINKQNLITPTSEQAREYGRKGGIASQKAQKAKKTLKEMFQAIGETTPPEAIISQLKKIGYDIKDTNLIDAMIKIASLKSLDKKSSVNDIRNFVEMYAKYTGQEPKKEVSAELSLKTALVEFVDGTGESTDSEDISAPIN